MLPAFPAVALLAGIAADKGAARVTGWISWFFSLGPLLWPLVVAIGVPLALFLMENAIPDGALVFLAAGVVIGAIAWHWLRRGRAVAAAALSAISAIVIYFGQFAFIVPAFDRIHLSKKLLFLGQQSVTCPEPAIISAGYVEPGLLFLSNLKLDFSDGDTAADFLNEGTCRVAFVEERQLASFRQRAEDLGLELADRGGTFGYNLGNGRWVRLRLFTPLAPGQ
jgi:MFS family permease